MEIFFWVSLTLLLKMAPVHCDARLQPRPEPGADPSDEVLAHGLPLSVNSRLHGLHRGVRGSTVLPLHHASDRVVQWVVVFAWWQPHRGLPKLPQEVFAQPVLLQLCSGHCWQPCTCCHFGLCNTWKHWFPCRGKLLVSAFEDVPLWLWSGRDQLVAW